jgi:hypothetical protein
MRRSRLFEQYLPDYTHRLHYQPRLQDLKDLMDPEDL